MLDCEERTMIRTVVLWVVVLVLGFVAGAIALLPGMVMPSRRLVSWVTYCWSRAMVATAAVRLTIENAPDVRDGEARFFVGNHQSALDIAALMVALHGDIRFMAKKSLFYVPVWGWALYFNGYVLIDRSSARSAYKSLERMLASLRRNPDNLVVFPEGTRSRDGRLLPFHRGAMKICQRAGLTVVPFSIDGSGTVLHPSGYRVRPGPVRLRFANALPADEVAAMSVDELHDKVRRAVKEGLALERSAVTATGNG